MDTFDLTPKADGEEDQREDSSMALAPSLLNLFDAVISRDTVQQPEIPTELEDHMADASSAACSAKEVQTSYDNQNYTVDRSEENSKKEPAIESTTNNNVNTDQLVETEECHDLTVDNTDGTPMENTAIQNIEEQCLTEAGSKKVRPASAEILMEDSFVMVASPDFVESEAVSDMQYRKSSRINPPIDLSLNSPHPSPPPSPPPTPKIANHGGSYLGHIVQEIVLTEYKYVRDLNDIIVGYMEPIRHNSYSPLNEEKFNTLFCNLREIYCFNKDFLGDLERCNTNPVYVAECFLENEESFTVYTTYCTNYPEAVKLLTQCANNAVISRYFRERQAELGHGLPLGAYLLKPVQRILKYHLLFQNLCKHYDGDREGLEIIMDALESMVDIARHINEMKRKHEAAIHVQEIQSQLHGMEDLQENITSYGDLILEDTFRMRRAERLLYLFEKALLICKKDDAVLNFKACIKCSNLMLIENLPKEPLAFTVVLFDQQNIQYTIMAKSVEQKKRWTNEIKRLILENYARNIPDNVKARILKAITPEEDQEKTHTTTDGSLGRNKKFRKSGRRGRRNSEPIAKQLHRGQKQVKAAVESFLMGMKRPDLSKLGRFGSDGTVVATNEILDPEKTEDHPAEDESPVKPEEKVDISTNYAIGETGDALSAENVAYSPSRFGYDAKRDSGLGSMTITEGHKPESDDTGVGLVTGAKKASTKDAMRGMDLDTGDLPGVTDKAAESPDELEVLELLSEEHLSDTEKSKGNLVNAFKLRKKDMKHYRRMLKKSEAVWVRRKDSQFRERSASNGSLPSFGDSLSTHPPLTRTVSDGICLGRISSRKHSYSDPNIAVGTSSDESSEDSSNSSLAEEKSPKDNYLNLHQEVRDDSTTGAVDDSECTASLSSDTAKSDIQVVEVPITATPHRVFSLARKFSVLSKERQGPSSYKNIRQMKEERQWRNRQRLLADSRSPHLNTNNQQLQTSLHRKGDGSCKARRSSKSDPFAERDGTRTTVTVSENKDGSASVMTNPEGSLRLSQSYLWRERLQSSVFTAPEPQFVEVSDDEEDDDSAFLVRGGNRRSVKESVKDIEMRKGYLKEPDISTQFQAPSIRERLQSMQEAHQEPVKTQVDLTKMKTLQQRLQELEQCKERPIQRRRPLHAASFSSGDSVSSWGDGGTPASSRRSSGSSGMLDRHSQSFSISDSIDPTLSSSRSSMSTPDSSVALEFKSLRERFEELEKAISKPVPKYVDPLKELGNARKLHSKSTSSMSA